MFAFDAHARERRSAGRVSHGPDDRPGGKSMVGKVGAEHFDGFLPILSRERFDGTGDEIDLGVSNRFASDCQVDHAIRAEAPDREAPVRIGENRRLPFIVARDEFCEQSPAERLLTARFNPLQPGPEVWFRRALPQERHARIANRFAFQIDDSAMDWHLGNEFQDDFFRRFVPHHRLPLRAESTELGRDINQVPVGCGLLVRHLGNSEGEFPRRSGDRSSKRRASGALTPKTPQRQHARPRGWFAVRQKHAAADHILDG